MVRRSANLISKKIIKRWKIKKDNLVSLQKKEQKSIFNLSQVLTIAVLTSIFSLTMGIILANFSFGNSDNKYSDEVQSFVDEYLTIKEEYYEEMDDKVYMKVALEAILNSLDMHSTVVDESLSNNLTTKLQGTYQGFGIEIISDDTGKIHIVGVIDDSPASEAGLKPLDIILTINGQGVTGLTTNEFVNLVKDSNETKFELEIEREGKQLTIELERKLVTLKSVASEIYERNNKKIGYIYVNVFAYNTDIQFANELKELEKQGIDSLIVDLRYNTGGHLTAVENMMSMFLDKSHVIYQIQTKKDTKKVYSKTNDSKDYKVVVLVNEQSASASEMFAATMQEEYKATVLGVPTFGKGTVQEVQDSTSTDVQYKLTTKKWLTPKGNWIDGVGVKPDIELELKVEDINSFTDEEDNQLQAAIDLLAK